MLSQWGVPLSPGELKTTVPSASQTMVSENTRLGVRSSLDFDAPYAAAKGAHGGREARARRSLSETITRRNERPLSRCEGAFAAGTAPFIRQDGSIERITLVYVNAEHMHYTYRQKLTKWLESRTGSSVTRF
jgi:hypothetical protein